MGGPQLPSAIALSKAIRAASPATPIIWGGHFPTNRADASLASEFVDYAVRGQGEDTFSELIETLVAGASGERMARIAGLSHRLQGRTAHNAERAFSTRPLARQLPYRRLPDLRRYLTHTCLGARTAGYQAALGCRFRCTFCGVAGMFRGRTALPTAARLEQDLHFLREIGTDAIQFYDHNFFDREVDMVPLLEVLARFALPWWCFARSDALLNLSASAWELVRRSRLRMAYIGAESPSDWLLHDIRKGTRSDQTLAAVELCERHGIIPELSFMLAPPQDPEGETERTFEFIRMIKQRHPQTEIMLYIYTPLPPRAGLPDEKQARATRDLRAWDGTPVIFPETAEGWAAPQWLAYWCHTDAPWVSPRLRQRILDFTTVLGCRFPTVTDVRMPRWGRTALRTLAAWRYRYQCYARPWELNSSRKLLRLRDPRVSSL